MLRRIIHALVGVVSLAALVALPQSPALAVNGAYNLWPRHANLKCIDVPNGTTSNVTLTIYWCNIERNMENQQWDWIPTGDGFFTIKNIESEKCIAVAGGLAQENVAVIQNSCNVGTAAHWRQALATTTGEHGFHYYFLVNRNSNKCLTVKDGGTAAGTTLLQHTCRSYTNQQWSWQRYSLPG